MPSAAVSALKRQLSEELLARCQPHCVTVAAAYLEIDVARLSDLRRGRYERFSLEWLIERLATTECSVSLTVHARVPAERWGRPFRPRPVNTPRFWVRPPHLR